MTAAQTPPQDPTGGTSVLGDGKPFEPVSARTAGTIDAETPDDGEPFEEGAAPADDEAGGDADRFASVREGVAGFRDQALSHARDYASTGKETLSATIDGYAETIREAAQQIENAAGPQVAGYAHQAAEFLEEAAETLRTKDVEELLDEARDLVRRSPALAIGAAAALGFALSRFLKATSERLEPEFVPTRSRGGGRAAAYDA